MRTVHEELVERIRGEVLDLDQVAQRALEAWSRARQMPHEQAYLDSVALNLHGFYSGLERLFELVARHIDRTVPASRTWHRDLLQQMGRDQEGVRPAVIGRDSASALNEFRRYFNHRSLVI